MKSQNKDKKEENKFINPLLNLKQPSSSSDVGTPEYPRSLERTDSGTESGTKIKGT